MGQSYVLDTAVSGEVEHCQVRGRTFPVASASRDRRQRHPAEDPWIAHGAVHHDQLSFVDEPDAVVAADGFEPPTKRL